MPPRGKRRVAGRMSLRTPVVEPAPPKGRFAFLAWPFRTGARVVGSILVAALTAFVVAYVATRQDELFDAISDAVGQPPLGTQAYVPDDAYLGRPVVLPDPLAPQRAAEVRDDRSFDHLIESTHAVQLGVSDVGLTIEGTRHETVIVERITARVLSRTTAYAGTFLFHQTLGGPEEMIGLIFELDGPDRQARLAGTDGAPGEAFAERNYVEVRRGEKVVFDIAGIARQPYLYEWVIDLVVQVGGERVTLTVGADEPYMVSGLVDRYGAYYFGSLEGELTAQSHEEMCPGGCVKAAPKWALPQ
jgi:hypothetical protein